MTSEKSILMTTRHYPDLGRASDWLKQILANQRHYPRRHQYGISSLVSQTSFRGETSGGVAAKCRLFSQAIFSLVFLSFFPVFYGFFFKIRIVELRFRIDRKITFLPSPKDGLCGISCENSSSKTKP